MLKNCKRQKPSTESKITGGRTDGKGIGNTGRVSAYAMGGDRRRVPRERDEQSGVLRGARDIGKDLLPNNSHVFNNATVNEKVQRMRRQ